MNMSRRRFLSGCSRAVVGDPGGQHQTGLIGCPERKDDGMSNAIWHPLIGVDEAGLSGARVQAHSAVQWLARAARAYIPAQPNDGHTNLGWSDGFRGFVTHALPDGARLALKVTDL